MILQLVCVPFMIVCCITFKMILKWILLMKFEYN
jgi:hypothetical protein